MILRYNLIKLFGQSMLLNSLYRMNSNMISMKLCCYGAKNSKMVLPKLGKDFIHATSRDKYQVSMKVNLAHILYGLERKSG